MADLNIVYAPIVEHEDPDIVIFRQCVGIQIFGACTGHWEDIFLPDEARDQIRKLNADSVNTGDAVKVPYKGSTNAERVAWLAQIIKAVDNRLQFITQRSNQILDRMKDMGSVAYDATLKIFTTAVASIPVIGSVVSFITGKQDTARAIEDIQMQNLIKSYANDITQLVSIRAQLLKEYASATGVDEVVSSASTPWPTWYYIAGLIFILLVLAYVRKRNLER